MLVDSANGNPEAKIHRGTYHIAVQPRKKYSMTQGGYPLDDVKTPDSVTEKISATASGGKNYQTQFYQLDAIIAVGYRVSFTEKVDSTDRS